MPPAVFVVCNHPEVVSVLATMDIPKETLGAGNMMFDDDDDDDDDGPACCTTWDV